jgi:hypothetical protein
MGIDAHYVHVIGASQAERLEHVEGTCRVWAPIIRDEHCPPLGQRRRDSDHRTWTLLYHHGEGIVRCILGFKMKEGILSEHDEVIVLGLQENMRSGEPGILEDLARDPCLGTALGTVR